MENLKLKYGKEMTVEQIIYKLTHYCAGCDALIEPDPGKTFGETHCDDYLCNKCKEEVSLCGRCHDCFLKEQENLPKGREDCASCEQSLKDQTVLECNRCGEPICEPCAKDYWAAIRSVEEGQLCQVCMDEYKTAREEKGHTL